MLKLKLQGGSPICVLMAQECFSPNQKKISQVKLNAKSTFEIEIVLIAKVEQLTRKKLFFFTQTKFEKRRAHVAKIATHPVPEKYEF